jgi:hypothetical protein
MTQPTFYSVPNSTHVTQETDQNYGYFKTIQRRNLDALTKYRFAKGQTLTIADLVLCTFGGDVDDGALQLENAFGLSFSIDKNEAVWIKVGAVPLTRACLNDPKVRHEIVMDANGVIDVDADPQTVTLLDLEVLNTSACDILSTFRCNGDVFRRTAPIAPGKKGYTVTEPYSRERQDALMNIAKAGPHFHATGGAALNTDDFFLARERKDRLAAADTLVAKKEAWQAVVVRQEEALAFIAMLEAEKSICVYSNPSKLNVNQLKVLVKWKYASKKIPTRKDELLAAWNDTMRSEPENLPEQWTNSDEDKLGRLQNDEIKIKDTELGRQANRVVMDLQSAIPLLSTPQRKVLRNSLGSSGPTNT